MSPLPCASVRECPQRLRRTPSLVEPLAVFESAAARQVVRDEHDTEADAYGHRRKTAIPVRGDSEAEGGDEPQSPGRDRATTHAGYIGLGLAVH